MKNFLLAVILCLSISCNYDHPFELPKASVTSKPWTYWWWMGNDVTKNGITELLELYKKQGIGGVHIIPIYGLQNNEENQIDFLSEKWLEVFDHTLAEAKRLGMGVDITTGTGWPFGGLNINESDKAKRVLCKKLTVEGNNRTFYLDAKAPEPDMKLIDVLAIGEGNIKADFMENYQTGSDTIVWIAPAGKWDIYMLFAGNTGQNVKRAAPGGEGHVLDYFAKDAIKNYLQKFDSAFAKVSNINELRAVYNDSYEIFNANWTEDFFKEFKARRGYNFKPFFYVLFDSVSDELHQRMLSDYHETISDMLLDNFTRGWTEWAKENGFLTRNQAHGSPGNLLDLYASASIPETESFGSSNFSIPGLRVDTTYNTEQFGRPMRLAMKMASSPADLFGKKLVSSETATWLADHFKVSLSQVKPQVDELFTAGINHIFYHGMTYSPLNEEWPGRLFYASTNFNQNSHFWNELPKLNNYITICQSILQNAEPDNDILVYFPIYDIWAAHGPSWLTHKLTVHEGGSWLEGSEMGKLSKYLLNHGYSFDFISDKQIAMLKPEENRLAISGNKYKTLVIPSCRHIPLETLEKIMDLNRYGIEVIFEKNLPSTVPGYFQYQQKNEKLNRICDTIKEKKLALAGFEKIKQKLASIGIKQEELAEKGLSFVRKKSKNTTVYFITNLSDQFYRDTVLLAEKGQSVEVFDPLIKLRGLPKYNVTPDSLIKVDLALKPGQSVFLFVHQNKIKEETLPYYEPDEKIELTNQWQLTFFEGHPFIPSPKTLEAPQNWVDESDNKTLYFSGTARYSTTFTLSDEQTKQPLSIQLGDVRESAVLRLNATIIDTLWCLPFETIIEPKYLQTENKLEIDVTNLSANRIKYLDEQRINWKKFEDINFVHITYTPFDASNWKPVPSGLLRPVEIYTLK